MVIVRWEIIFGVVLVCFIGHTFSKTRQHTKKTTFEDVPESFSSLDASCLSKNSRRAPYVSHARVRYAMKRKLGGEKQVFLLATYECFGNRKLLNGNSKLYCSKRKWLGARPICLDGKETQFFQSDDAWVKPVSGANDTCPREFAKGCEQDCSRADGKPTCRCYPGFEKINGHCQDINECSNANGGCQHTCSNFLGSYICSCRPGFRLQSDGRFCEDINECLLRNGHGPCEDSCENESGSYKCFCTKPGSKLAADGHSCDDLDECSDGTAGCSHGCINTRGKAFCTCPHGMVLKDDWKNCEERALSDQPGQDENEEDYEGEGDEDYGDEDEQESDYGDEENENDRDEARGITDSSNHNKNKETNEASVKTHSNNVNKNDSEETATVKEQVISSTHVYDVFKDFNQERNDNNTNNTFIATDDNEMFGNVLTQATPVDAKSEITTKAEINRNNNRHEDDDEQTETYINENDYESEDEDDDYNEEDENSTEEDYVETTTTQHHNVVKNVSEEDEVKNISANHGESSTTNYANASTEDVAGHQKPGEIEIKHDVITSSTPSSDTMTSSLPSFDGDNIVDGDDFQQNYTFSNINETERSQINATNLHRVSLYEDNLVKNDGINELDNRNFEDSETHKPSTEINEKNIEEDEYDYEDEDYNENDENEENDDRKESSNYNSTGNNYVNPERTSETQSQRREEEQDHNIVGHINSSSAEIPKYNDEDEDNSVGFPKISNDNEEDDYKLNHNRINPIDFEQTSKQSTNINDVEKPPSTNRKETPNVNEEDDYDYGEEEELDRDRAASETDYKKNEETDISNEKDVNETISTISHDFSSERTMEVGKDDPARGSTQEMNGSDDDGGVDEAEYDYKEEDEIMIPVKEKVDKEGNHRTDDKEETSSHNGGTGESGKSEEEINFVSRGIEDGKTLEGTTVIDARGENDFSSKRIEHVNKEDKSSNGIERINKESGTSHNASISTEPDITEGKIQDHVQIEKSESENNVDTRTNEGHTEEQEHHLKPTQSFDEHGQITTVRNELSNTTTTNDHPQITTSPDDVHEELDYDLDEFNEIFRNENHKHETTTLAPSTTATNNEKHKDYDDEDYDDEDNVIESSGDGPGYHVRPSVDGRCGRGYKLNEIHECVDINECEDPENGCSDYCQNTVGSYKCTCADGYEIISGDKYTCKDIDECLKKPCSHTCVNLVGSFRCECPEGWHLSSNTCERIVCSHTHKIVDGQLTCECPTGFMLTNSTTCEDVDECVNSPCDQACENTPGSYECGCGSGYVLIEEGRCVDRDECEEGLCAGPCQNLNGSYRCICDEGFVYDEFTKACVDIDECIHRNLHDCSQTCINTEGSYDCACREGYILHLDGASCEDINECLEEDVCGQLCNNTVGSYQCHCKPGFTMNSNRITCDDVNECLEYNGNCTHFCANLEGRYECACDPGYELEADNRTCIEVNPCNTNNGGCSHTCENIGGKAACGCPKNHELIEHTCFKINPCNIDNGGCSHRCEFINDQVSCACPRMHVLSNDTHCDVIDPCFEENGGCSHFCENRNGTAICSCPDETFELKSNKCFKINLCLRDNGGCSHFCKFRNESVVCECPSSHKLMDKHCHLINPCESNNGGCSHFCEFASGQVVCACPENYDLMGNVCEKVDPCMIDNGGCSHECVSDEEGNVKCFCPPKYVLQGNDTCVKQNPCLEDNGGCTHICVNHRGKPKCFCPFNYELMGKACVKIDPCLENNGNCSHVCNNDDGVITCDCPSNLVLINETSCTNPCAENNGGCSHQCTISKGKIQCGCPPGHELHGNACTSIDPCKVNNGGCSHQCINNNGQVNCTCPDRYQLKGKTCRRVNLCLINNGGCSHTCTNHRGRAKCSCPNGYSLHGKICIDNEPCSKSNGGCSHICNNNNGLRICSCPAGYLLRPNKRICKDVNECVVNQGGCSHECRNLPGSYSCHCPVGYKLNPDGSNCDKENYCEHNGGCQHICKSFNEGRRCECYEGYTLSKDGKTCEKTVLPHCPIRNIPNSMVKCTGADPNSTKVPPGSRCYIWCDKGYKLVGEISMTCSYDGNWEVDEPHCIPVSCPKLIHPENGRWVPSTCGSRKSFIGETCKIHCRRGFRSDVTFESIVCQANLQWSPSVSEVEMRNICKSDIPKPFIRCPSGGVATFNLPPGQNTMFVKLSRPDSNVDWWRYVSSNPSWGMKLGTTLPPGRFEVTFTAHSPNMNSSSSCVLLVEVKDAEAPKMSGCPANIDVRLSRGEFTRNVHWQEPHFEDNIAIRTLYKSKESGTSLGPGVHHVNYVASDDAGNRAMCHFTVTITDADFSDNRPGRYRAVLICPHGVQYMSNSPDHYDNTITTQQGCHWSHIRVREPSQFSRYKIPSRSYYETNSYKNNHVNGESAMPHQIRLRHMPFSWHNRCC